MIWNALIAAAMTVFILIGEHWFPWKRVLGHELSRITSYILGVLAIILPLSGFFIFSRSWLELLALWMITSAGGLTVIGAYIVDSYTIAKLRADADKRDVETLRKTLDE